MGLIYYKGEEYTEMPPILANAITLTEEEAERYNISLVDADVQEITLNTGERLFLGAPMSNFICKGLNITQATSEEELLAKIKPVDAYTKIPAIDGLGYGNSDSGYNSFNSNLNFQTEVNVTLSISGTNAIITAKRGGTAIAELTVPASDLNAYGGIIRRQEIFTGGLKAQFILVAWTKNENDEFVVLASNSKFNSSNGTGYCAMKFNGWNEGEYDYACGITGKFSYVTKEEWDEIVAGQGG